MTRAILWTWILLAAGPVVQELSQTFDAYWNNHGPTPVQSLISRHQLLEMQASVRKPAQGDGDSGDTPADGAAPQPHRSRAKNDTRAASPHLEPGSPWT